jgi:hypothetical protein
MSNPTIVTIWKEMTAEAQHLALCSAGNFNEVNSPGTMPDCRMNLQTPIRLSEL